MDLGRGPPWLTPETHSSPEQLPRVCSDSRKRQAVQSGVRQLPSCRAEVAVDVRVGSNEPHLGIGQFLAPAQVGEHSIPVPRVEPVVSGDKMREAGSLCVSWQRKAGRTIRGEAVVPYGPVFQRVATGYQAAEPRQRLEPRFRPLRQFLVEDGGAGVSAFRRERLDLGVPLHPRAHHLGARQGRVAPPVGVEPSARVAHDMHEPDIDPAGILQRAARPGEHLRAVDQHLPASARERPGEGVGRLDLLEVMQDRALRQAFG